MGDNNGHSRGMALVSKTLHMKRYGNIYGNLCSYANLELAFRKARKGKTAKHYVVEFEKNLKDNLLLLRTELLLHCYSPHPLVHFIVKDPKTRKISKSAFKDRIVHHALCNIIEPLFENTFIHDSYANRKGKGTLNAIKRFDGCKRTVSKNNTLPCYVLKADIRKYFDNVDHSTLLSIIKKRVKDAKIMWLIRKIFSNYHAGGGESSPQEVEGSANLRFAGLSSQARKGMPLGNLTSQFFANVFLNELDQFVKHKLKATYYIRYVDDFVILHNNKGLLEHYKWEIQNFLKTIKLELHPDKSKIILLNKGVTFLGYRIFSHHKLLKKSNLRKFRRELAEEIDAVQHGDLPYDTLLDRMHGWLEYSRWANTHALRNFILSEVAATLEHNIADRDIDRWLKCLKKRPQPTGQPPTVVI